MNGCGHEDCQRVSGYPAACLHGNVNVVFSPLGGVALAEAVAHRHHWVYDGVQPGGSLVYHCDDLDPPVVRQVWPGVTL
jgi:hypothetical protein